MDRGSFQRHRAFLLGTFASVVLSVLFLLLLAWRVDLREAVRVIRTVDYRWAVPAMLLFSGSKFIHTYRWRVLLSRWENIPLDPLFAIYLMHNLTNAIVPFRAGDVVRVQVAGQRLSIPPAELTATVFVVETLLDGVAFLALLLAGLVFLDVPAPSRSLFAFLAVTVPIGFLAAVLLARIDVAQDFAARRPLRWLPARPRAAAARMVPRFLEGMVVLREPRLAVRAVLVTFPAWLTEGGVYWMLGSAFHLDLAFTDYVLVMVSANVVVSLPVAPLFDVGPYEVVVSEVLVALGVDRAAAGGYAIGAHLLLLCWIGITGIAATAWLRLTPRDLFGLRQPAIPDSGAISTPPGRHAQ